MLDIYGNLADSLMHGSNASLIKPRHEDPSLVSAKSLKPGNMMRRDEQGLETRLIPCRLDNIQFWRWSPLPLNFF